MKITQKVESGTTCVSIFFSKGLKQNSKFWNVITISKLNGELSYSILVYDNGDCVYNTKTREVSSIENLFVSIQDQLTEMYSCEYLSKTKLTLNIPNGKKRRFRVG
jgi:hypothetical protein